MRKINTPSRTCITCKKIYYRKMRIKVAQFLKSLYCSRACHYKGDYNSRSGENSHLWKNGLLKCIDCGKERKNEYTRKRCRFCANLFYQGKNHPGWKENLGYKYLHLILRKENGAPTKCMFCKTAEGRLEWANKEGNYTRNIADYIGLCVPCHRVFDSKNPKRS